MQNSQPAVYRRKSSGLSHFFEHSPARTYNAILDLGGLNQENVNFLGHLGCRIHALDLLSDFDDFRHELPTGKFDSAAAEQFVHRHLKFEPEQFDAILAWDALEHLDLQLLSKLVPWLNHILAPGGGLLTFFHTQSRGATVPVYRYLIEDTDVLTLRVHQERILPQTFSNRNLENLFSSFNSIKFFLTRDSLREVIAVR
ncbi:MAG: hypothetical protein CMN58_00545 [Solibacterales bacterium]|nr:hypothetical protein [Bryobacterales bacterium]